MRLPWALAISLEKHGAQGLNVVIALLEKTRNRFCRFRGLTEGYFRRSYESKRCDCKNRGDESRSRWLIHNSIIAGRGGNGGNPAIGNAEKSGRN